MIEVRRVVLAALWLAMLAFGSASAQTPTGTITGLVTDASKASVAGARVLVTNPLTAQSWEVVTSAEGVYTASALLSGDYRITVEAVGFARVERSGTVEAGTTTTIDIALELGTLTATVSVHGAPPLLHYDHHQIGNVVRREQIENIPLNGRSFLELAKLEPGVTSPVRGAAGNRTFISTLGSGLQTIPRVGYTRVTVDGASINALGTVGTSLQISPDMVEEFQLSTAGFDARTNLTTNGYMNVVTRSGTNELRGSGFGFYRDHRLAAYPALRRDPRNPHPSFKRDQIGSTVGGPLRRNRMFFIASYERVDQDGVQTVQPGASEFASLGGIFGAPAEGDLFSARVDRQIGSRLALSGRYTLDSGTSFSGLSGVLPSGWSEQGNTAQQGVVGLTSLWPREIVHEFRLSYFHLDSQVAAADSATCSGCFGLGAPRITVAGAGLTFGTALIANSFTGGRYQLSNNLAWQRGRHRLQFGVDWEHSTITNASPDADRVQITAWSPQSVRQANPAIALPDSFTTIHDVLQLPLQSFDITIGPGAAIERDFAPHRIIDLFRVYVGDTWRIAPRLTVNLGLGWSYEPNALNHDLVKPDLLAPLLGDRGLNAPPARANNVAPTAGFAWAATADARTVVRGGVGRYFDPVSSTNSINLATERYLLSPLGTGRLSISGANIRVDDVVLNFTEPSAFTVAHLLAALPTIRADLARALDPANRSFDVLNINRIKQGMNLYDPDYRLPSAVHVTVGVQRQLARDFVVSADVVWKRFDHTFINGIDYNRFNSAGGPLIPRCSPTERDNLAAACSNGPIMFDTTSGRARYAGMLVRGESRLGPRGQLLASYAFGSYVGSNGTGTGTAEVSGGRSSGFNNDNWFENYGPLLTDLRHIVNVSGYVDLPWRLQLAFNVSANSRPPFTAWIGSVDLNGDGTTDDLLPGTTVNQFGRGLDADDLSRLVDDYNRRFANTPICCGQTAPRVVLPSAYDFNDTFFTQDVRITHTVPLGAWRARIRVFGEVFNLFNTANLVGHSGNLRVPATFGQPAARFTQIFGSGGPRAFQLGARVDF